MKGTLRDQGGFSLLELAVAMGAGIFLMIGTQEIISSLTYQSQKAGLRIQEQLARMVLKSIVRSEGCTSSTQSQFVNVLSSGPSTVYQVPLFTTFNRAAPTATPSLVSSINFAPYTLTGQSILIERCRTGLPPADCGASFTTGVNYVFEARFRLTLQFGTGIGAQVLNVDEPVAVLGSFDGTNLTLSGCRAPAAAASPSQTLEKFCNSLGPGGNPAGTNPGGLVTPGSGANTGMFRPTFYPGTGPSDPPRCLLRLPQGAAPIGPTTSFLGGPLAYAVGGGNGDFVPFQDNLLGLVPAVAGNPPTGCRNPTNPSDVRVLTGFESESPSPTIGPFNCFDPSVSTTPTCNSIHPGCVKVTNGSCLAAGYDAGFSLIHSGASWTPNATCSQFNYLATPTSIPGVCGNHCN